MINGSTYAYNELETLADNAFKKHGVKLFYELPATAQEALLKEQDRIFEKYGVTLASYPVDNDIEFIAAD